MDIQRWDRAKEKVGNTFELTVLIQKRVRELIRDRQRPLVDFEHRNPIQIALEEILQDKIYLAPPTHADNDNMYRPEELEMPPIPKKTESKAAEVAPVVDPTAAPSETLDDEDLDTADTTETVETAEENPTMSALD